MLNSINYYAVVGEILQRIQQDDYSENQDEAIATEIYDVYFKDAILNTKIDIKNHEYGCYDGLTVKEVAEKYKYSFISRRIEDSYRFSIELLYIRRLLDMLTKFKNSDGIMDEENSILFSEAKEKFISDLEEDGGLIFNYPEMHCSGCGVHLNLSYHNGVFTNYVRALKDKPQCKPCGYDKDTMDTFSVSLNVASGKLVVANDFRSLFKEENKESDNYIIEKSGYYNSINSDLGKKLNTEYYASKKMIYVYAGNSCPSIFYNKNKQEIVFKREYHYNSETDEETSNCLEGETLLGYVCTDLWAVQCMDYNDLAERCQQNNVWIENILKKLDCVVIDVEPGVFDVVIDNRTETDSDHFFSIKKR